MKRYPQPELHFDEKELKTDLGSGNTIFVGSSCDMWADSIPTEQINTILAHCSNFSNIYIFQSKNPQRFTRLFIYQPSWFPINTTLGTTIESNRTYDSITGGQIPWRRMMSMRSLSCACFVSIEPIMDFDLDVMVGCMREIKPEFVSIGADSGQNNLPEPSVEKVQQLIKELQGITDVKIKDNLKRII
jgi:protein gp37